MQTSQLIHYCNPCNDTAHSMTNKTNTLHVVKDVFRTGLNVELDSAGKVLKLSRTRGDFTQRGFI